MVKKLERVERCVDPEDVGIMILSGLNFQYDAEVPTREWIERAVTKQYDRLQSEQLRRRRVRQTVPDLPERVRNQAREHPAPHSSIQRHAERALGILRD